MAGDSLNQVGKSIRKIKEDADYASKRVLLNKKIERTRDVFDTTVPFEMEFRTDKKTDRVSLDLKFSKPPPRKGCNAECFSNNCLTYSFTDGGDHLINLGVDYIPNTIKVFRNRTLLSTIYYAETDPAAGLVYVQGSGTATDEITVCYVTGDCQLEPFDASCYAQSLTVSVTPTGGGDIYLVNPGFMFYNSEALSPPQYWFLYAGASYSVQYFAFHQSNEWAQNDSVGGGLAEIVMGGPGYAASGGFILYSASIGLSIGATGLYTLFMQWGVSPGQDPSIGGSSVTGRIYYVGGSDPRFTNIPIECGVASSGQTVVNDTPIYIGDGIWRTAFPFILGTLSVTINGLPVVFSESSNQTFILAEMPNIYNYTIIATYIAE